MLYAKIALLALFASLLAGSPAHPTQPQADATPSPVRHLNLRLDHPLDPTMYLALYRPAPLVPTDMSAIVLLPGAGEGGMASLRVKTRADA